MVQNPIEHLTYFILCPHLSQCTTELELTLIIFFLQLKHLNLSTFSIEKVSTLLVTDLTTILCCSPPAKSGLMLTVAVSSVIEETVVRDEVVNLFFPDHIVLAHCLDNKSFPP